MTADPNTGGQLIARSRKETLVPAQNNPPTVPAVAHSPTDTSMTSQERLDAA